jgi:hypothetical protein
MITTEEIMEYELQLIAFIIFEIGEHQLFKQLYLSS